jgi:DNA-binding NarL/FixJ family response regulator
MLGKVVRIVVAGDPRLLRQALCDVLSSEPDFEVVGEADSGRAVGLAVGEAAPDVLLLDITLLNRDPQTMLRELLNEYPELDVVVLSLDGDPLLMRRLLDIGVRAYLHKNISKGMLKSTIRDVADHRQQTVTISLPARGAIPLPRGEEPPAGVVEPVRGTGTGCPLSGRELQVLTYVAEALTNRQIASRMEITEGTVKRHLRNVFHKLRATSRIDAVNKAIDARLIEPRWVHR